MASLERGLRDLLVVWTLVASQALFAAPLGERSATLLAFTAAVAFTLALQRGEKHRPALQITALLALGALAGFAAQPFALQLVALVGRLIGLAPGSLAATQEDLMGWLCGVVFAPIFEEIAYRQRVLIPLAAWVGRPAALLLTSVLFALPHVHAWAMLGSLLVGLGLAAARFCGGSLALCVGLHTGLNAAGSTSLWLDPPRLLAGAACVLLALSLLVARRTRCSVSG